MSEEKKFSPRVEVQPRQDGGSVRAEVAAERAESLRVESEASPVSIAAIKAVHQPLPDVAPVAHVSAQSKDPVYLEVEHVLEEGLGPYYQGMNPKLQQLFKSRGETLAASLALMVTVTKVNIGKVVELIRRWLMLIPGVSRFFLEQEAKIRADRIAVIAQLSAERQRVVKR